MNAMQLEGKTAVITGGAGGIGFAIAKRLAEAGVSLVLADLSIQGEDKAGQLRNEGHQAIFIKTNICKEEQTESMAAEAARLYGGIDILVNSAGIYPRALLLETTEELWDSVMNINLKGMFLCCKAVVPYMKMRAKGTIVNLGSSHASIGLPELFVYSVSKGGVNTLTRNLAGALAPERIRVNCVNPGWVATEKEIADRNEKGQTLEQIMAMGKTLPLGRMQTVEDAASIVLFLVSELASQITGQIINVDGGKEVASLFDDRSHDTSDANNN